MRVIDFFCGGGGFSEGFRQAGFEVVFAVDNWQPAVDTHNENHPEGLAINDDVLRISNLPDKEFHELIPNSEVIVGSPPCTDFSNSNRSGGADKSRGIALVEAYLKIVARKMFMQNSILKYWILENVPKVENFIEDSYRGKYFGLDGRRVFKVKGVNHGVYNAKYFGVPSNRKRYFCGNFPKPETVSEDEKDHILLRNILIALGEPNEIINQDIIDPIYNISIPGNEVTDHHYIQRLSEFEIKKATRLKMDKGFMGRMSIPENLNKPARTIMATMSFTSRECFVLGNRESGLRAPTIREVATLMSFPIDYKFYGNSLGTKYRMVGNAVPPKMSYALAKAILREENQIDQLNGYHTLEHANNLDFLNLNFCTIPIKKEKQKKATARFKYHIPYFKFDTYRVELTNNHSDFKKELFVWNSEIHYNQGKDRARIYTPNVEALKTKLPKNDLKIIDRFFGKRLDKKIVDHDTFQKYHCLTIREVKKLNVLDPYKLLEKIREYLDDKFEFDKDDQQIDIFEPPFKLPRPIIIGYIILSQFVNKMPKTND